MSYIENNLIVFDGNMYLEVDSWIKIITVLSNITLRKGTVKPYRFDKTCMDKELTKDKLYK